jgi:hypothetical protein
MLAQPAPSDARGAATTLGEGAEVCGGNPPTADQPQQKQKRAGPGGPRRRGPPRTEAHEAQSS